MRQLVIPVFIPEYGCPGRCLFCDQRRISGQQVIPSPQEIHAIIEEHLATIAGKEIDRIEVAFFGGTFTSLPENIQEGYLKTVKPYVDNNSIHAIRISTRPDRIWRDNLLMLKEYGVWLIELGIQSLDDRVLQVVGRGYKRKQVMEAVYLIRESELSFGVQLMPGLPGADRHSDCMSALICAELKPRTVRIYPTLVITGTGLHELWLKGEYSPLTLEEAVEVSADIYEIFEREEIPVIRIGLQPTEELRSDGVVAAGPFHPALGELVKSRVWRRQMDWAVGRVKQKFSVDRVKLMVPCSQLSQAVGQHRENVKWLMNKYGLDIDIIADQTLTNHLLGVKICEAMPKLIYSRQEFYQNRAN